MQNYVDRLIRCGYSPSDAYSTCHSFIREFNTNFLELFILSVEKECGYVD